jgi:tRNA-dihydrouridine synthase B
VRLPNNLFLSPMAGYSDLPFRLLARRHGAGLVCSEMVAAMSVNRGHAPHLVRMVTTEEERPTSVQIFGTEVDEVADAAGEVERHCDVLGFNMGCPAYQIQRAGCGAALLDRPEHAQRLVEAIKGASRKPLLVKMRAGNGSLMDVQAFARGLERSGADGIIFHARTARQGYSGTSDWDLIRRVKATVAIPVVGNGDIVDGPSAENALARSGADGIAVGRASLGDPRIFQRIAHYLTTGQRLPTPTVEERAQDFLEYLTVAARIGLGTTHILQQAQRFTRGVPGAARIRSRLHGAHLPLDQVRAEFESLRLRGAPAAETPI